MQGDMSQVGKWAPNQTGALTHVLICLSGLEWVVQDSNLASLANQPADASFT